MDVKPISIPETLRCATPTIAFDGTKLVFGCKTEDVEFHYEVKANVSLEGKGKEASVEIPLSISVYASKDEYEDSDVTTKTIQISTSNMAADANGDGVVDAADIVTITNIIMSDKR